MGTRSCRQPVLQPARLLHPLAELARQDGVERLAQQAGQGGRGPSVEIANVTPPRRTTPPRYALAPRGVVHRVHEHPARFGRTRHLVVDLRRGRRHHEPGAVEVLRAERAGGRG